MWRAWHGAQLPNLLMAIGPGCQVPNFFSAACLVCGDPFWFVVVSMMLHRPSLGPGLVFISSSVSCSGWNTTLSIIEAHIKSLPLMQRSVTTR